MPETVQLGDRFWLLRQIHELAADDQVPATNYIEQMERAYRRDDTEQVYESAKNLVALCLVDDVDPESVEKLSVNELGQLVNAISDEYDVSLSV